MSDSMDDSPWKDVPSQSAQASPEPGPAPLSAPAVKSSLKQGNTRQPSSSSSSASRGLGSRKASAKVQATKLEAVEDAFDPLSSSLIDNPATSTSESAPSSSEYDPPPPIAKSPVPTTTLSPSPSSSRMGSLSIGDQQIPQGSAAMSLRPPSSVQSSSNVQPGESTAASSPKSIGIEYAAQPIFEITVHDPHKVGDLTSSHIEYQVRTKTTSKAYREEEFAVSRRYSDFRWLYDSLHNNNPGVIVPPPPEKQAVGRFNDNFVEARRAALEKMLNKIAAHPTLQLDSDLKIFLESGSFAVDVKNRENRDVLETTQRKGMLSAFGLGRGAETKFVEPDEWFRQRKEYLEDLQSKLQQLMKGLDNVVSQRNAMSETANAFSVSLNTLSRVEITPGLAASLEGLSDVQLRIQELYSRSARQDVLTLGIVLDEYIRLIESANLTFTQRAKMFESWRNSEAELAKRRAAQDKLLRQGKSQQDRLNQVAADVAEAERKVNQGRLAFEGVGKTMRMELERFEKAKIEDFKSGVETYLESAVEAQKELIDIWETFLVQLDDETEDELAGDIDPSESRPNPEAGEATP